VVVKVEVDGAEVAEVDVSVGSVAEVDVVPCACDVVTTTRQIQPQRPSECSSNLICAPSQHSTLDPELHGSTPSAVQVGAAAAVGGAGAGVAEALRQTQPQWPSASCSKWAWVPLQHSTSEPVLQASPPSGVHAAGAELGLGTSRFLL